MASFFTTLLLLLFALYAAFLLLLYSLQRYMIYHPDKSIRAPSDYGLSGFTEESIRTPDGESLQLWHHAAADGFPTIVYFHGNAGNLGTRVNIYGALAAKGFGVLAVSYRGYGRSTGFPSEAGLYTDARAAIAYVTGQLHVPIRRVILFGESLGTGVAVQMATEFEIAALILQAPYTSVAARAAEIYYYAPIRLLIKDIYDSLGKIQRVKAPLLAFHGEKDAVIPVLHGKKLVEAATCPKKALYFASGGHNDFDSSVISEHVLDFTRTHKLVA